MKYSDIMPDKMKFKSIPKLQVKLIIRILIILSTIFFISETSSANELQIQEQSHWGKGPVYAVKAIGNFIFAGEGTVLSIKDSLDPLNPIEISEIDLRSSIRSLSIDGNYVYVATETGIVIVDIINKNKPTIVGLSSALYHNSYQNSGTFTGMDIVTKENRAYVAADAYGFVIYDVTNKSNPLEIGWLGSGSLSVDIVGNIAYIGGYGTMKIIDISNPKNPTEISTWSIPADKTCRNRIFGLKVKGDYAYLAQYGYGIYALNVSNPKSPLQVGYIGNSECGETANKFELVNNFAYVSWWYVGLVIIDLSDPTNMSMRKVPSSLGNDNAMGYNYDISVNGNYVYMAGHYKGISIFDISNPTNASIKKFIEPRFGRTFGIIENGNYLYAGQDGYLATLDISDVTKPVYLNEEVYGGRGGGMTIIGNNLYHTGGWTPLIIYDISNPAKPAIIKKWGSRINGGPYYANRYLHVASDDLYEILDVSDNNNIKVLGSYKVTGLVYGGFTTDGNYTYIVANDQFQIFNVSNPNKISIIGNVTITKPAYSSTVNLLGNYAYIKSGYDNIAIIDISNLYKPIVVNQIAFKIINDIHIYNNYLIVSGYSTTRFYNLSINPVNPTLEKEYSFKGLNYLTAKGLYSFKGYDGAGITIYNHNILNFTNKLIASLGDLDHNGVVDINDLIISSQHMGEYYTIKPYPSYDLDDNGALNIFDLLKISRLIV